MNRCSCILKLYYPFWFRVSLFVGSFWCDPVRMFAYPPSQPVAVLHISSFIFFVYQIRSHFPLNVQFLTCCRFVMDNTQAPNSKVKVCLLEYLKDLILMMNPDTIAAPTPEINQAISRIISWSTEPKSADVRRVRSHYFRICSFFKSSGLDKTRGVGEEHRNASAGSCATKCYRIYRCSFTGMLFVI